MEHSWHGWIGILFPRTVSPAIWRAVGGGGINAIPHLDNKPPRRHF